MVVSVYTANECLGRSSSACDAFPFFSLTIAVPPSRSANGFGVSLPKTSFIEKQKRSVAAPAHS